MSNPLIDILLQSPKVESSKDYDAEYESLPVVIAESTKDLDNAFARLDEAGGYGYIATWRKKLVCIQHKTFI
jgi:hypothetical protein